jgi:predicted 3-demethylubiquinone-9 3-methyltransferase (glyoxalase superfamily)
MNKITPFLWFNNDAEAAADFYLSVFPNSRRLSELRCNEAGPLPVGALLVLDLELNGQPVTLMNGGPGHPPTDAFSFSVQCETQAEIDSYWSQLTADGGSEIMCGWLKDKFGLCWQIVPTDVYKYLRHPAGMRAMMTMKKMDIATLQQAANHPA